ncbi:MPN518 family protein [Mycoplasmoides genitalium]
MSHKINDQTLVNEQRLLAYDFFQNSNKVGLLSTLQYLDFVNFLVRSKKVNYLLVNKVSLPIYQKIYFDNFPFLGFDNNLWSAFGLALRNKSQNDTVFAFVEKTKNTDTEINKFLKILKIFKGLKIVFLLINSPEEKTTIKLSDSLIKEIKKQKIKHEVYSLRSFQNKFFKLVRKLEKKHKSKNNVMFVELNGVFGYETNFEKSNIDFSFTSFQDRFTIEKKLKITSHFILPHKYLLKNLENIKHPNFEQKNLIWQQTVKDFNQQFLLHYSKLQVFSNSPTKLKVDALIFDLEFHLIVEIMKGFNFDENCICLLEGNKEQNPNLPTVSLDTKVANIKTYQGCYFLNN